MRRGIALGIGFALATSVIAAAPAVAANKVTRRLSASGYTVVAVSTAGRTVSVKATGKRFALVAPGPKLTLHLVAPNGSYAGPVVVGTKGRKAVLGVRAGAALGKVKVKRGFATTVKALAKKSRVSSRTAPTARSGAPVGAAGYGLVAGATATSAATGGSPDTRARMAEGPDLAVAGEDPDGDGLPNTLDVDANGNSVIDMVDPNAPPVSGLRSFVNYFASLDQSVNIDADPGSAALIDQRMQSLLELVFLQVPAGAQLNCLGLSWCSPGGTGEIIPAGATPGPGPGPASAVAFPACCDPSGSGYGDIYRTSQSAGQGDEFRIFPRATSAQIKTGDVLIMRVPQADGTVQEVPGTLGFVFNSVAAVKSWTLAGSGQTIGYPVAADAPGTNRNPWPVSLGDGRLTLTYWRPQRSSIPGAGEPEGFMDIGGLRYDVQVMIQGQNSAMPQCVAGSLSTTDPNLTVRAGGGPEQFVDTQPDRPADPANTLSFTVDLSACAAGKGVTLTPGTVVNVGLEAFSPAGGDHVVQDLYFRVQ